MSEGMSKAQRNLPPERWAKIVAARREKMGLPPLEDDEVEVADEPAEETAPAAAAAPVAASSAPAAAAAPAAVDPAVASDPVLSGKSKAARNLPPERWAKIVAARREKLGLPAEEGDEEPEPVAAAPAPTPVAAAPTPAPAAAQPARPAAPATAPAQPARPAAKPAAQRPAAAQPAVAASQSGYGDLVGSMYTARMTPALAGAGASAAAATRPAVAPQPAVEEDSPARRRVIRYAFFGALAAVTGQMVAGFLVFFYPKKVGAFGGEVPAGSVADFPLNSVTRIREGKYYISHVEDGLLALYWKCVHLGCTVPWAPNVEPPAGGLTGIFQCPCHGSLYNRKGEVIGGPAPRPLDIMEIRLSGGRVIVNTGKITVRTKYEPTQAAKI